MEDKTPIRIYVACLAAYNNGMLHGAWIDAHRGVEHIKMKVRAMLKVSPIEQAEEWAIHDYEGFEGIRLSEYEGFDAVAQLAAFIVEHGALGAAVYNHYNSLADAEDALENHYHGEFTSLADFAEALTEETSEVPKHLEVYIDYERMARDLEITDVLAIETGFEQVHVFWSH